MSAKKLVNKLSEQCWWWLIQDGDKVKNIGVDLDNHMKVSAITSVRLTSSCRDRQGRGWSTHQWHQGLTIVILLYGTVDKNFFKIRLMDWSCMCLNMPTSCLFERTSLATGSGSCLCQDNATHPQSCQLSWTTCVILSTSTCQPDHFIQQEPNSLKDLQKKCKPGEASFPTATPNLWNRLTFSSMRTVQWGRF